jgi:hypothetical protein
VLLPLQVEMNEDWGRDPIHGAVDPSLLVESRVDATGLIAFRPNRNLSSILS